MKRLETFLPAVCVRRPWSDRLKILEQPLFPTCASSAVFNGKRLRVLNTPGVLSVVGAGSAPAPVPDEEISCIRTAVGSSPSAEPWAYLTAGQGVQITSGTLEGLRAILVQAKNEWRVALNVDLLMRSLAVAVDRDCLAALPRQVPRPEPALAGAPRRWTDFGLPAARIFHKGNIR